MSIAVVVTFQVTPADMDRFMALITANATASLRDETGCQQFDVATDPDHPGEVFLYERYDDAAAFATHAQTAHYKVFDGQVGPLIQSKAVRVYHNVQP